MSGFICFKLNKKLITVLCNAIIIAMIALLYAFSTLPGSSDFAQAAASPYYKAASSSPSVCLLINVYEGADKVKEMLDILDSKGAKATFFLGGYWVKNNANCAKMIAASNNEIGSHGYMHLDHKKLSYEANLVEMNKAETIIESTVSREITLFAPPSGAYGKDCLRAADSKGYMVILWSKDTIDWRDKDSATILARATKNPAKGDFILMHPTAATVAALPLIIDFYQSNGYNLFTVSEALS